MLKTLLAIGLVSALGGGSVIDNDAPYGMPRYATLGEAMLDGGWSEVTSGDHAMVLVPALGTHVGPFAASDLDAVVDRMLDVPLTTGGGVKQVVVDNGAPGATWTTKWSSQHGEQIIVSKKGASEDEDDFVKRHLDTVRRAQKASPPI